MKKENLFYLAFILTVLISRISVYLLPNRNIVIFGLIIHHFWFGFLVFIIALLFKRKADVLVISAIGLGLMADELIFIVLGGGGDLEYWSKVVVFSTCIILLLIYFVRRKISKLFIEQLKR